MSLGPQRKVLSMRPYKHRMVCFCKAGRLDMRQLILVSSQSQVLTTQSSPALGVTLAAGYKFIGVSMQVRLHSCLGHTGRRLQGRYSAHAQVCFHQQCLLWPMHKCASYHAQTMHFLVFMPVVSGATVSTLTSFGNMVQAAQVLHLVS